MKSISESLVVVNNKELCRFEAALGDDAAVLNHRLAGDAITFTRTGVPPAFCGQGIAPTMSSVVLDFATEEGLWGCVPQLVHGCPYS
jgi:predicted GNAT family acetyltransferase